MRLYFVEIGYETYSISAESMNDLLQKLILDWLRELKSANKIEVKEIMDWETGQ